MAEGHAPQIGDADRLIKDILERAKGRKLDAVNGDGSPDPAFLDFVQQIATYSTGEQEQLIDPDILFAHTETAWNASKTRKPGSDLIVLHHDLASDGWRTARMALDVITDDKPFLVDSLSSALTEFGKNISFFINAVIDVARDQNGVRQVNKSGQVIREAVLHIEMDPAADEKEPAAIEAEIRAVLSDVALAVNDWEPMRARLAADISALERARPVGVDREDLLESIEFLKWLWDNRFAFLGARRFAYTQEDGKEQFEQMPEHDLGILRDHTRRVLRASYSEDGTPTPAVRAFLESPEPLIVAKANAKSVVHRRAYMDYVGVKVYAPDGRPAGEDRFVGLFTAEAYNRPASDIPLLKRKMHKVIDRAAFPPASHNEKALRNLLETFPRDEIFQVNVDELADVSLGILRLFKRPHTKLFLRRDRFDRFISALVFIPRERFNSDVRAEIGEILREAYDGRVSAFYTYFGEGALARVHFIIGISEGAPQGPAIEELEARVAAAVRTWADELKEAMRIQHHGAPPAGLFAKYERAFSAGYMEANDSDQALADIAKIEHLSKASFTGLRAYRRPGDGSEELRLKLYILGGPMPLSDFLPILENMGLEVMQEAGHPVRREGVAGDLATVWVHDFHMRSALGIEIDLQGIRKTFEEACAAVMHDQTDDDGFNALVINAGLNWREAALLRACAKHHIQAAFSFSQSYMEEALNAHPALARRLVDYFHARFHPLKGMSDAARDKEETEIRDSIFAGLDAVPSLDQDRIMRRFAALIGAITRTNYYQKDASGHPKSYISFKIASRELEELPAPKPYREIFVSSPRVEGVHLRFGRIARGGLRWSDRREDFRTEILDLVKAQQVKNAVIVPVGAKGGFVAKQLPTDGDRDRIASEGQEAYKCFIRGLLDLTDNVVDGEVKTPEGVVARDDKDPYLVVAADKGTAKFSDIANQVAQEYGFWLGDAFASGGSAGYDHKTMGITARGAWEAVKRHFRETGVDIQTQPFRVMGIGDMSGDVFGNGMLLSRQIKLIAAFDHRDIFIDPDPDPETSYKERERLFNLPRSSWQDYDKDLISVGGGVFSRTLKSIPLSPQVKDLLKIKAARATPTEILSAILKADTDLFWMGGIGTYYKGSDEQNWQVGDRANDAIRVNGDEAGARVIGEGGNLGLTQLGRIAFAEKGGRINTDAIDNSAGVDCSDHEVNIKILLNKAIVDGGLKAEARDPLLVEMTDEVADHVLRHNYSQTLALTLAQRCASEDLDSHERFMLALERDDRLNRELEHLPGREEVGELKLKGEGLARPELAVLLAYAKNGLFEALVDSDVPDDPHFTSTLYGYFPKPAQRFEKAIAGHTLRREIIATQLANDTIDQGGPTFVHRLQEGSGCSAAEAVRAFEIARHTFRLGAFNAELSALDNKLSADLQSEMYNVAMHLLRRASFWFVSTRMESSVGAIGISDTVARYQSGIDALSAKIEELVSEYERRAFQRRAEKWSGAGVPEGLARRAAAFRLLLSAPDIIELALAREWPVIAVARVYFGLGALLDLDAIRGAADTATLSEHFDRLAARRLMEDLMHHQRALVGAIIDSVDEAPSAEVDSAWSSAVLEEWANHHVAGIGRTKRISEELDVRGDFSVAKLALVNRQLRELAAVTQNVSGD